MRTRIMIMSVFLTMTLLPAFAQYKVVLQSGHEGPPTAMARHKETRSLLSMGQDGRLIVIDPNRNQVLHRFRITHDRVHQFAVDPSRNRVALVTADKNGQHRVSVWDWKEEKLVFERDLETQPLFLIWSARGRYLAMGKFGAPSVLVLDGRTGRQLSHLRRLSSLFNTAYIGSTETILMTYAASGVLQFWDIRSSALKLSVDTQKNLQELTVLQTGSKSTLFARRDQSLYLINRQSGDVLDQMDVQNLAEVSIDEDTGELDLLSTTLTGTVIHRYRVEDGRFVQREPEQEVPSLHESDAVKLLRSGGRTVIATADGRFFEESSDGFTALIRDGVWKPAETALHGQSLFLSGPGGLWRFTSPFFEARTNAVENFAPPAVDLFSTASRSNNTGVEVLPAGDVLTWDRNSEDRGFWRVGFREEEQFFPLSGRLDRLTPVDSDRLLSLDFNGTVNLLSLRGGETLFTYSALGVLDASYSALEDYILVGKSSGRGGAALERVDVQTGESVPIPDERFMVYRVAAGPRGLYSIGVQRDSGGRVFTSLVFHNPAAPEKSRILRKVAGEDLDAYILPHPSDGSIYTTLGGKLVRLVRNRAIPFDWDGRIRDLAIRGNMLYGIDDDGALVLWNALSGNLILSARFFVGGDWIVLSPRGNRVWATPGAVNSVALCRNGLPVDRRLITIVRNTSLSGG